MDLYGAPFVQPARRGVLQVERDQDWYATLAGLWEEGPGERAAWFGVSDADELDRPARAACAPFQRIGCYLTGNKQNFLQPQWLAAVGGSPERRAGVQTLLHWANLPRLTDGAYGRWPQQFDGVSVRYPTETGAGFRLEDLLGELARMDCDWREPPPHAPGRRAERQLWRTTPAGHPTPSLRSNAVWPASGGFVTGCGTVTPAGCSSGAIPLS
jgi:hypothetical protein